MLSAQKAISVFGSSTAAPGSPEYGQARRVGRLLAQAGFVVVTGGFGGLMAAACQGAREAGGHTVGITLPAWGRPANPWVCEERPQSSFVERLLRMTTQADGYVALEGGVGTLTEFSLVWSLLETGTLPPRPFVVLGERWRRLLGALAAELILRPEDLGLITVADTPEAVVEALSRALAQTPGASGAGA